MKTVKHVFLSVLAGVLATSFCGAADAVPGRPVPAPVSEPEPQKRFDLDFKGGSPQGLVNVVEKATKEPLNVIIPEEHRNFLLPPLTLRDVTVPQLFNALTTASQRTETRYRGNVGRSIQTAYGFLTSDRPPHANSIWHFFVQDPDIPAAPPPPQQCRFWQLEPYLEKLKVEDITTAIETGWKMLGVSPLPKLTFHKDTKLLVVVGEDQQLRIVDDVLRELTPARKNPKDSPGTDAPAGEKPSKR